ncbi:hypothetical protein GPM19_04645 [Halomonas sp. ZH2S]|uniref:Uncharacterized protein n=1 Tax=Vreelandella zhuhanensis TaxID=2684210 RepID=A0A7X3GZ14_9GAMM|nr:hypothetical protein [Halomonas zhuhanensis]MWJ27502.1 hypothetical protein [Halomonas zhuhanensis]
MSELSTPVRHRLSRRIVLWAGGIGLILVALGVAWLAASHWLLNSQWLAQRLSQAEGVEISWESGTSRHPGRWELTGLYLARDDSRLALSLAAEQATIELSLLAMLRGELHITSLNAQGIRRLTLNEYRLEGDGNLQLEDTRLTPDYLEIPVLALSLQEARIDRGSSNLSRDIALNADLSLERVTPSQAGPKILSALSGRLDIQAYADAWDVFNPYLQALPWLSLSGHGRLQGELSLSKGVLQAGSRLRLDSPRLRVEVDELRLNEVDDTADSARRWSIPRQMSLTHYAQGQGNVTLEVPHETPDSLSFAARWNDVMLSDGEPYAEHTHLTLLTQLPNQPLNQLEAPTHAQATLKGDITRLDMLDRYLAPTLDGQGFELRGYGSLDASVSIVEARPSQAELRVESPRLEARALGFAARGRGLLNAVLQESRQLSADITLNEAELDHHGRRLLTDADLDLHLESPLDADTALAQAEGSVEWKAALLPDIAVLQYYLAPYLPSPSPLVLAEGSAQSDGRLSVTREGVQGKATLTGRELRTRFRDHSLTSEMRLDLTLNQATLDATQLDISGSRLSWQADSEADTERLESLVVLRKGHFQRNEDSPSGQVVAEGMVQHLGFLNTFLPDAHGLAVDGNGQLRLQLDFEGNRPLPGSRLRINADNLYVGFLDHQARGRGELTAQIDPDDHAQLSLVLPRFELRRTDDPRPHLEGRHFALVTQTRQLSQLLNTPDPRDFVTQISLPITQVPDLRRYNAYLPEEAGITFLGGQASLSSEMTLKGLKAEGNLELQAFGAELSLLDQHLRGDLTLAIILSEGDLKARRFQADGSRLRLDNVQRLSTERQGAGDPQGDAGWWVQLDLQQARLHWAQPLTLESQLQLSMRDSGLLARLFLQRARDNPWLGRLLNVRNIEGTAQLDLDENQVELRDIQLHGGENLSLLADLMLSDSTASGALYARLGVLALGVGLKENSPELHLISPRRWFNDWRERQP